MSHPQIDFKWTRYYVDKSTIDWDHDYFSRFVDHDPDIDPGLGVYQNCDGQFDLSIVGTDIVNTQKQFIHPLQKRYYMESGYDEDFVICPTLKSIKTGNIPIPFRVNHHQFHPTHKLVWVPDSLDYPHSHYILKGIKHITSGTEISFDYNYGPVIYSL